MHHTTTIPWARLYERDEYPDYGVIEAILGAYFPVKCVDKCITFLTPTIDSQEWVRIAHSEESAWSFIEQWVSEH